MKSSEFRGIQNQQTSLYVSQCREIIDQHLTRRVNAQAWKAFPMNQHETKITLDDGDLRDVLPTSPESCVDFVTDPPYGLALTGNDWGSQVPSSECCQAVARACKPGTLLLVCDGTRTWHRLACAIEDAGLEIPNHDFRSVRDRQSSDLLNAPPDSIAPFPGECCEPLSNRSADAANRRRLGEGQEPYRSSQVTYHKSLTTTNKKVTRF